MHDYIDCVKVLVKGGADVNRRSGPHHNTPLHHAVKLGPDGKDMVKTLLQWVQFYKYLCVQLCQSEVLKRNGQIQSSNKHSTTK